MPSSFSWPVLVPSALRAPAPVNLGVGCLLLAEIGQSKFEFSRPGKGAAGMTCSLPPSQLLSSSYFDGNKEQLISIVPTKLPGWPSIAI